MNIFDNNTGIYTVPCDGDYQIELVVNFKTNVPIPIIPTSDNIPQIQIYDLDASKSILSSNLSSVSFIVPISPTCSFEPTCEVSVTGLLSTGQVIIKAIVPLNCGQRIVVRATNSGLAYDSLDPQIIASIDFSPPNVDTTLGIYKLRDTPVINIDCNNC